jgi:hypothetical protein
MGSIVKCPQCNEVNGGSLLHCSKCQTSLIGIPRVQVGPSIPEFVKPPIPPENYRAKSLASRIFKYGIFPFSFGGIIEIPLESDTKRIISTLTERIKAEKPNEITSTQSRITFYAGFFRLVIGSWNLLTSINYGVIDITPAKNKLLVSYKIWFIELLIVASAMAACFAFVAVSIGILTDWFSKFVEIWLWLFGVNFILTIIRFHNLVRSAVDNVY